MDRQLGRYCLIRDLSGHILKGGGGESSALSITGRMNVDEVDTDVSLAARLLTSQFPQWADLPIKPVPSAGTDNAIHRLGDDMVVRLPRIHWATEQVDKEHRESGR